MPGNWRVPLFKVNSPPWDVLAAELRPVIEGGYWAEGETVKRFEDALRTLLGAPHLAATASCTSALAIALRMSGAGPGRQVVVTPMTCLATVAPIVTAGAKVVWADVEPDTGLISPRAVERAINDMTAAVVAVYWGGDVPNMAELRRICYRRKIPLIADMAQALGAPRAGATMACYSFQAIKALTTGDGGCIVCEAAIQADLAKSLSWFGIDRKNFRLPTGEIDWDLDVPRIGFKANMNNVTAAFGLAQLPGIGGVLEAHRRNAVEYERLLAGIPGVRLPPRHGSSASWVFTFTHDERDDLLQYLQAEGVQASKMHTRLDRYSGIPAVNRRPMLGLDRFASRHLCVPCGWWMTTSDVGYVAGLIRRFAEEA